MQFWHLLTPVRQRVRRCSAPRALQGCAQPPAPGSQHRLRLPGGCAASQRARRGGQHGRKTLPSVPHPEQRTWTAQTGRYPGKYDLGPHCSVVNPNGLCLYAAAHGARTLGLSAIMEPEPRRGGAEPPAHLRACAHTHTHTHSAAVRPPPDFTPQQAEPRVRGGAGGGGGSRLGRFARLPGARHGPTALTPRLPASPVPWGRVREGDGEPQPQRGRR